MPTVGSSMRLFVQVIYATSSPTRDHVAWLICVGLGGWVRWQLILVYDVYAIYNLERISIILTHLFNCKHVNNVKNQGSCYERLRILHWTRKSMSQTEQGTNSFLRQPTTHNLSIARFHRWRTAGVRLFIDTTKAVDWSISASIIWKPILSVNKLIRPTKCRNERVL